MSKRRHLEAWSPVGEFGAGLPSELWGCVSLWLSPSEYAKLARCMSSFLDNREQSRIWRYYCHMEGYARRVPEQQAVNEDQQREHEALARRERALYWQGPEVRWYFCFLQNKQAEAHQYVFAYVQFGNTVLRIPARSEDGDDSKATATQAWLFEHGWRPRSLLQRTLRKMLEPTEVPLRFRELVASRPGAILRRIRFFRGASGPSTLVEWPVGRKPNGDWVWKRPPRTFEELTASEQWEDSPAVRSGPHPWGRGYGWLVELNLQADDRERMGIPASSAPEPRWVHVGKDKTASKITLQDLRNSIKERVMAMGFPCRLDVLPAAVDRWEPEEKVTPSTNLITDLRWTQGERLHLRMVNVPVRARGAFRPDPESPEEGGDYVVLFQRDTVRPWQKLEARPLIDFLADLGCEVSSSRRSTSSSSSHAMPTLPSVSSSHEGSDVKSKDTSFGSGCFLPTIFERSCSGSGQETRAGLGSDTEDVEVLQSPPMPSRSTVATASQATTQPVDLLSEASRGRHHQADIEFTLPEDPVERDLPHECRLVLSSSGARQFEFHPNRHNTVLAGRKDGVITVIDHEVDSTTHLLEIDSYPILGLSWLHTNPQWAVCGVSQSGTTCLVNYDDSRPGHMESVRLEPFSHLSSLSVNCTDEYFMTSGFCVDLGLYDIVTGRKISTFRGVHQNFINILRFSNRSPQVFATASFDHTCKVWDLRQPVQPTQPARLFKTDTLNVMCTWSPDDRHILCSGIDASLQQFNTVKQAEPVGTRFPLPSLRSMTNYRRALYLTNGDLVATAATNESFLRICMAASPHRIIGRIDFKGKLLHRRQYTQASTPLVGGLPTANSDSTSRGLAYMRNLASRLSANVSTTAVRRQATSNAPSQTQSAEEYVQSLRCHPHDRQQLGALLSTSDQNPESYIMMLNLGKRQDQSP
eukprot:TRINITY_DN79645_c0_g1_i1.p1 TRINITY_DN79645_c0_g1~~TRINITY_DN79645_c0_g1_i1.p1  ORF type:complete len:924 (+),score=119.34 TRINITY_DN79645_c0_g1_i1:136-2907(+)